MSLCPYPSQPLANCVCVCLLLRLHPGLHHAICIPGGEEDGAQTGVAGVGSPLHSCEQWRGVLWPRPEAPRQPPVWHDSQRLLQWWIGGPGRGLHHGCLLHLWWALKAEGRQRESWRRIKKQQCQWGPGEGSQHGSSHLQRVRQDLRHLLQPKQTQADAPQPGQQDGPQVSHL